MSITTIDKRNHTKIKVGALTAKQTFTLIGSDQILVIIKPGVISLIDYAECFNISTSSTVNIENYLGVCPCDIEISILDKADNDD